MSHLTDHQKGVLAILLAAVLWSTGGLFIKLISLDAVQISFFRSFFAALVFLFLFGRDVLRVNTMTFVNALLYAGVLLFFVMATKTTTAANAIFLQYTAPIYVLILEPLLLRTGLKRINVITITICFGGMFLFFVGDLDPGHMQGNLLALLSGLCFAGFMLGMRKNAPEYQYASIFWGNALLAVVTAYSLLRITAFPVEEFLMVMYLGVVQIGLAYVFFSYGLKRVLAVEASLIAMIEPVLNPIWVLIGYGEIPTVYAIIGGLIILMAVGTRTILVDRERRRTPEDTEESRNR